VFSVCSCCLDLDVTKPSHSTWTTFSSGGQLRQIAMKLRPDMKKGASGAQKSSANHCESLYLKK
ncbi:MAG: hypothetical protein ACSHX0_14050, partial [Akkermansiaceae bacterium]